MHYLKKYLANVVGKDLLNHNHKHIIEKIPSIYLTFQKFNLLAENTEVCNIYLLSYLCMSLKKTNNDRVGTVPVKNTQDNKEVHQPIQSAEIYTNIKFE